MASRLIPRDRSFSAARWLARAAVFPCLGSWLLVRLWTALGGRLPGVALGIFALALSALLIALCAKFDLVERLCLPFRTLRQNVTAGGIAFLLGGCFDISYAMLESGGLLLAAPFFRLLCHAGSGAVFAVIVLALIRAGKDLLGLGRVRWRQMLILFLALNALTAVYVLTSRTVYVWDNAGYWAIARALAAEPFGYAHLRGILETTLTLDYNHLLAFPISLFMRLFGGSRAVFVFAVSNLYTLPGLWGLAALAKDKKWGGLALAGLFPMLTYIGLVGYVDVAAAGLGIWAYVIYTSDRPAVSRGIFTGALLVGTFLLRRYFFFFAASFGVAALVVKVIFERKKWADFAALFASCAVCALTFTYRFLLDKVLGTDYGDLYSAYDLGLKSDALLFCRYFGLALLAVFLLSALVSLVQKEARPKLTLGLVQLAVCFLAFVAVQSHGQQHLLLYLPALALLAANCILTAAPLLCALLAAATTLNCLIPKAQPASIGEIAAPDLLPSFTVYGPRRADIDTLLALTDYVNGLSEEEPHTAVVLSSSFSLNTETLTSLYASLNLPEPETRTVIQYHGTVDKRDAFNWNTAQADYLIVGDPVQTHLGEENQEVLALLVHDLLEHTGPGTAYAPLPDTFLLENGALVRIYQRVRDWTAEDYFSISRRLTALYPDYASLYQVPDWITP